MTATYLLPEMDIEIPTVAWFDNLRDCLGIEADLYNYIKVAAASEILQLGFDETEISGEGTLNIWLKIVDKYGEDEICYLSNAEFLIGGTADEVVDHIAKKFKEAQSHVEKLRSILTERGLDADEFVPLKDGGILLQRVLVAT